MESSCFSFFSFFNWNVCRHRILPCQWHAQLHKPTSLMPTTNEFVRNTYCNLCYTIHVYIFSAIDIYEYRNTRVLAAVRAEESRNKWQQKWRSTCRIPIDRKASNNKTKCELRIHSVPQWAQLSAHTQTQTHAHTECDMKRRSQRACIRHKLYLILSTILY